MKLKNNRVLLGMSGGVDSSMAAYILQKQGYEVLGVTFMFSKITSQNENSISEAKALAAKLNFEHIVVDLREEFEKLIVSYFIEEYLAGRTPFPCAHCNPKLKFKYLEKLAQSENCAFISTGHYVRTGFYKGQKYIYKGIDPEKDQSFFLWGLSENIIDKLIFPLGNLQKSEVRKLADENGFKSLAKKRDSLGVCFIEGNDYRKFLEKRGLKSEPGNFVDHNNNILGQHTGITNYTIGQRRGLGLNLNYPVFVSEIRLDDNEIVLQKYSDLYRNKIVVNNYHLIDNEIDKCEDELIVKVRYRLQETPCNLNILDDSRAEVELLKSEAMISPGQTAVFYKDDRLVGGGFIESAS